MKSKLVLINCLSIHSAMQVINTLSDNFLKAHKRREKVALMLSSTSDGCDVRCHYDNEDIEEVNWLKQEAEKLI
jgi:hypothetical protein